MFNTKEPSEAVGFDSQWKVKKVAMQGSAQTLPITTENVSLATTTTTEINVQTEPVAVKTPEYDEERLAAFLKKLYPRVSKELNEAASSQVFKNYHAEGSGSAAHSKLLSSFKLSLESGDFDKSVSALSWNATGNKLAISVVQEHDTWCHHLGMIFVYSFHGSQANDEKLMRIKTPNCVTATSYHPTMPPILAIATYTGEVLIVNTQNDENEQILVKSAGHENVVTQILWIEDLDNDKNHLLATGSLDGFLIIWNFNLGTSELQMKDKYKIRTPLFGKLQRKTELPPEIAKKVDRGIVSFDFSKHSAEKFVVAAEGGLIAQCSRLGAKELPGSSKGVKVFDPVVKYYRAHEGEITAIAMSPDRADLFLTNGTDGEIRIYDLAEEEPGNVILTKTEKLAASWVPYSQNLLAACGAGANINLYNARSGKLMNDQDEKDKDDDITLTSLAFHRGKISVVALGTKDGTVQIWDIPWNFY